MAPSSAIWSDRANQTWFGNSKPFGSTDIHDVYNVDTNMVIGAGSFGSVFVGRSKATGQTCAIKRIAKPSGRPADEEFSSRVKAREAALRQEVHIMEKLEHKNIVRLFGHFEDHLNNYLVIQLCSGGKVIDCIAEMQDYGESDASFLMQQVLHAIAYMHGQKIVHMDVKPDNMMLQSRSPLRQNTLQLIDFGLSCECSPSRDLRLVAGTPDYMSPQAIDGRYNIQTDLWSCGASMYELLCGYVPFRAETDDGVFAAVRRGNFTFAAADWRNVSDSAKDLLRALLKMNPRERLTADQALGHQWVRRCAPGAHGNAPLQRTMNRFCDRRAQRESPQPEAHHLPDVRVALSEVTSWVNSLLPQYGLWDLSAKKVASI